VKSNRSSFVAEKNVSFTSFVSSSRANNQRCCTVKYVVVVVVVVVVAAVVRIFSKGANEHKVTVSGGL